jgi:hypothetical protein
VTGRSQTDQTRQRMRERFLKELAQRGIVLDACAVAGVARPTVYEWRGADPEFAKAWEDALEIAADVLEREAWRRAVEGVDKPLIGRVGKDKDGVITTVKEYSDTLMGRLLGARRPEKFRERHEITQNGVTRIKIEYDDPHPETT